MIKILGPNDPALEALSESIKENPGLECELTIVAWENYRAKLDETLASSEPKFDAVCIPGHIWLPQLANDGLLKPFDGLLRNIPPSVLKNYDASDVFPSIREECQFTGADGVSKQFVMPLFTDGHIVFYRSDLVSLPEVIAPSQWHTYLQALTLPDGVHPFAMKAHNSEIFLDFLPYFWDFGAQLWDDKGNALFNSEAGAKALDYYASLRKYCPGNTDTFGNGEILDAINTGKVAIITSWGGQAAGIFDNKNNTNAASIKTAALQNAWNATWGVTIPAKAKDEKAAQTLAVLMQLMGKDGDAKVTRIAGSPVRISSYSEQEKQKYPWLHSQQALLENCRMLPVDPAFGAYLDGLYSGVYKTFTGKESATSALADAAK